MKKFKGIDDILSGKESTEISEQKVEKKVAIEEKMVTTSYRIKPSLHKKIKFAAIEQGKKEHEIVAKALQQYFDTLEKG